MEKEGKGEQMNLTKKEKHFGIAVFAIFWLILFAVAALDAWVF